MTDEKRPSVSIRRSGRNNRGLRVLAARCTCGWVHMTAYRFGHKRRARYLLIDRGVRHMELAHAIASAGLEPHADPRATERYIAGRTDV